jgi:hypothetical protein
MIVRNKLSLRWLFDYCDKTNKGYLDFSERNIWFAKHLKKSQRKKQR